MQRKRKLHQQTLQDPKRKKSQGAPLSLASMEFGQLAETYVDPAHVEVWKGRTEHQALEAIRRASAEIFFHTHYNASDFEKNRARLEALEEENEKLKAEAKGTSQELSHLHAYKQNADKSITLLKSEESRLRTELNSMGQSLTAASERIYSLENEVTSLKNDLQSSKDASFEEGFKSYVTGFLAVDPDYNWSNFGEDTLKWMEDFKVQEAQAITEKRALIEQEKMSAASNPTIEARPQGDDAEPSQEGIAANDQVTSKDAPDI